MSRVYLPKSWANDDECSAAAGVSEDVGFETKGEIAPGLINAGIEAGARTRAVVADAGYGDQPPLLDGLEDRRLPYVVRVPLIVRFRTTDEVQRYPGDGQPPEYQGIGRPRKAKGARGLDGVDGGGVDGGGFHPGWTRSRRLARRRLGGGARGVLRKLRARVRVHRVGYRGTHLPSAGWLIGERSANGRPTETKYYFASGIDRMSLDDIVESAHCRWMIERFYQDAKGEVGLDDYEGRLWSGFHRHVGHACSPTATLRCARTMERPSLDRQRVFRETLADRNDSRDRPGDLPPEGRRSLASIRRLVLERMFAHVIEELTRARVRSP